MPSHSLHEMPDFPKWEQFYKKNRHLNIYTIAQRASLEFGGAITTWRTRFDTIRNIGERNKLQQHHEAKDEAFLEFVSKPKDYQEPKKQFNKKTNKEKIVVISDPHEPYSSENVWTTVFQNHKDAHHIHINGDIADFYSKSRFRKSDHKNFSDELSAVFSRLEWLATHWERVTLIRGNHDDRAEKRMALLVDSDMLFLTETDLLRYMCAWFSNVEVVGERAIGEKGDVGIDFIWQMGDVIFTHIERSQKQSSALLDGISTQLHRWSRIFKLEPYRVIIQAHNHRATYDSNGAEHLFLCPMCADVATTGLKYALSPSLAGNPPIKGYIELYQVDGITDLERTKMHVIE